MTRRPYACGEVEKHLLGEASAVSIISRKDEIIRYIRRRFAGDSTSDGMDEGLGGEIVKRIPESVSEM